MRWFLLCRPCRRRSRRFEQVTYERERKKTNRSDCSIWIRPSLFLFQKRTSTVRKASLIDFGLLSISLSESEIDNDTHGTSSDRIANCWMMEKEREREGETGRTKSCRNNRQMPLTKVLFEMTLPSEDWTSFPFLFSFSYLRRSPFSSDDSRKRIIDVDWSRLFILFAHRFFSHSAFEEFAEISIVVLFVAFSVEWRRSRSSSICLLSCCFAWKQKLSREDQSNIHMRWNDSDVDVFFLALV